ncbi:unnamed protein product [Amoebophrya sp. A120]|nr:unnamed protein product [Amoebophrya sp. A120]|eukprot:GSA120T00015225001.1
MNMMMPAVRVLASLQAGCGRRARPLKMAPRHEHRATSFSCSCIALVLLCTTTLVQKMSGIFVLLPFLGARVKSCSLLVEAASRRQKQGSHAAKIPTSARPQSFVLQSVEVGVDQYGAVQGEETNTKTDMDIDQGQHDQDEEEQSSYFSPEDEATATASRTSNEGLNQGNYKPRAYEHSFRLRTPVKSGTTSAVIGATTTSSSVCKNEICDFVRQKNPLAEKLRVANAELLLPRNHYLNSSSSATATKSSKITLQVLQWQLDCPCSLEGRGGGENGGDEDMKNATSKGREFCSTGSISGILRSATVVSQADDHADDGAKKEGGGVTATRTVKPKSCDPCACRRECSTTTRKLSWRKPSKGKSNFLLSWTR